ncbi:MAG: sugar-binding domain-containing protein [Lachnospiraceae bacterium]
MMDGNFPFLIPSGAESTSFNDGSWDAVTLPHDFSISQNFTTSGEAESGFLPGGTGWYRKSFTVPSGCDGKSVILSFDGVYQNAYVYVNGKQVGENHYGYTSFAFDISKYLVCDGLTDNVIAVKVVNKLPSSRWYSGSGIYRDVNLIVADQIHVIQNGTQITTPDIENGVGTVSAKVKVANSGTSSANITVPQYRLRQKRPESFRICRNYSDG